MFAVMEVAKCYLAWLFFGVDSSVPAQWLYSYPADDFVSCSFFEGRKEERKNSGRGLVMCFYDERMVFYQKLFIARDSLDSCHKRTLPARVSFAHAQVYYGT